MLKNLIYSLFIVLLLTSCGAGSSETIDTESKNSNSEAYPYIPRDSNLTDAMAYRFLNMATFGATPELVTELRTKGVEKWLDDQLAMEYDPIDDSITRKHVELGFAAKPYDYDRHYVKLYKKRSGTLDITVDQFLADNIYFFFQQHTKATNGLVWNMSTIFEVQLEDKQQVRQRVAYALSQIVIASESVDSLFRIRGEALSYYYDVLVRHAFGNYEDVLYDASMTPAMATYLTYDGNQKEHIEDNVTLAPDENYGREIMQLFSLGLFDLNMDGSVNYRDSVEIPTYTQEDVVAMARVFTGLHSPGAPFGVGILNSGHKGADSLHPLDCAQEWHDSDEKLLLGTKLPGSKECLVEVKSAIDLLMNHHNIAPFISKKLIMRLTKSNPESDYIFRVATVFEDNGNGEKGDLKEVTRAILLDEELWEDLVNGAATKIKEPYLSLTGMLRAFDVEPGRSWEAGKQDFQKVTMHGKYRLNHQQIFLGLGQAPTMAPNVFNFYQDSFVPNTSEFKTRGYVAPEIYIYTMKNIIRYNNYLSNNIMPKEINYIHSRPKTKTRWDEDTGEPYADFLFDMSGAYEVVKNLAGGDYTNIPKRKDNPDFYIEMAGAVTDWLSIRLIGEKLPDEMREIIVEKYGALDIAVDNASKGTPKFQIFERFIEPITKIIIASDAYSAN